MNRNDFRLLGSIRIRGDVRRIDALDQERPHGIQSRHPILRLNIGFIVPEHKS